MTAAGVRLALSRRLRLCAALAALAGLAAPALAADCAFRAKPVSTPLAGLAAVSDYRPALKACVSADGRKAFAIRTMAVGGEEVALLADPERLTTRLERAACWTCRDAARTNSPRPAWAGRSQPRRRRRESRIAAFSRTPASPAAPGPAPSSPATSARASGRSTAASSPPWRRAGRVRRSRCRSPAFGSPIMPPTSAG